MRTGERFLAAYASAEAALWKADHDAAMRCFEVEEFLAAGNLAFKLGTFIEATWQGHVAEGSLPYKEEVDREIGEFYRSWVEITERNLAKLRQLEEEGFDVKGADEFLAHLEEARCILESRALESEMRPVEEILPLAKGNPRPERYGR
jgi:hypothetical protein